MTIWQRIAEALSALASGEGLSVIFDRLRTEPQHSVAFTIAVIALGAKMAKADGLVTRDEVSAFREVFDISRADEKNAARVYNLARQDVAGFDSYARQIASMFDAQHDALLDILEGLFYIAVADGNFHINENDFLTEVARIFGLTSREFSMVRARFVEDGELDPYEMLGATPQMPVSEIRKLWRKLVLETHPDQLAARGVPEEAMRMAEKRLIQINKAWEQIERMQDA